MMNRLNVIRLKKAQSIGKALACFPYVRCIILNGSLASGKSNERSDIDLLIIAKSSHIFTARFFVMAFMQLFGLKRAKFDSAETAGKYCLNYFLTENNLKIFCVKGREEFCARNYAASKFLAGDYNLFIKFMQTNEGLFEKYSQPFPSFPVFSCHPRPDRGSKIVDSRRSLPRTEIRGGNDNVCSRPLIQRITEWKLNWLFGIKLEAWAKHYQIKKIESDPRTKNLKEEIHYSDSELRFHPPKG